MNTQTKVRNNSIDLTRLILASLVVMLHCNTFFDVNPNLYYAISLYGGRLAVPFFFCIAGYFYCKGVLGGKAVFFRQFRSMLKLYVVWSLVYYACSFVVNVVMAKESLSAFLIQRALFFFTNGSYPHLWYFPALLYSMIIFTLIVRWFHQSGLAVYSCICVLLYLIGVLGSTYLFIGNSIPILSQLYQQDWFPVVRGIVCTGFPSFTAGAWVNWLEQKKHPVSNRSALIIVGILAAVAIAEDILLVWVWNMTDIFTVFGFLFLPAGILYCCNRFPLPQYKTTAWYARRLASAVYFIHPLIVVALTTFMNGSGRSLSSTPFTAIVYVFSLLFGWAVTKRGGRIEKLLLGTG